MKLYYVVSPAGAILSGPFCYRASAQRSQAMYPDGEVACMYRPEPILPGPGHPGRQQIDQYHPAARQPRTLTARLVEAGLYSSIQSARPVVLREPDFATITVDLAGTWVDPEEQAHRVEVKGVAVEVTPEKYLK